MNRAETSRINGAKSQGPATAQGKAAASKNATKHGLSGNQIILAHESQDEWETFRTAFHLTCRPLGAFEEDLVDEMAAARWRLRRIASMERALIESEIRDAEKELEAAGEDVSGAPDKAYANLAKNGKALGTLHRYASRLRREAEHAASELRMLQSLPCPEQPAIAEADAAIPVPQLNQPLLQNEPERTFVATATASPSVTDIAPLKACSRHVDVI